MKKSLKNGMAEFEEKQKKALTLSIEDLSALSDDDLFLAVIARTENKVNGFDDLDKGVN